MAKRHRIAAAKKATCRRRSNPLRRSATRHRTSLARRIPGPRVRSVKQPHQARSRRSKDATKVGFVFCNDPDPMLIERMWALEETGQFSPLAIFWHRSSDLSFPFSPTPFSANRFTRVALHDGNGGILSKIWLMIAFAWRLRQWARYQDLRILHVVYPNMLIAAFFASLGRKTEIVYDIWDVNHCARMPIWQRMLFRLLLSKTKQVYTTSPAFIDEFLTPNQILRPETQVTHVSNSPYDILRTGRRPTSVRSEGPLTVGCVGNLRVHKQLGMLLDAVTQVRASGRDVRIRLSGAGSRKKMVAEAASEADFIEYTGPYDYRRDAAGLYSKLDLVFAVYPQEIFNYRVHVARRFHDAVLSGKPIVVSRGSHMGNLAKQENVGWEIGHEAKEELIKLLTQIYDDRDSLIKKSQNTRFFAGQHTFMAYRERYVSTYLRLRQRCVGLTSAPSSTCLKT